MTGATHGLAGLMAKVGKQVAGLALDQADEGLLAAGAKAGAANWRTTLRPFAQGSAAGIPASADRADSGTNAFYGVGASYALLDNLDLRGKWERYDFGGDKIDLLTAGAALKF